MIVGINVQHNQNVSVKQTPSATSKTSLFQADSNMCRDLEKSGCKENHFYSLLSGQAEASIY